MLYLHAKLLAFLYAILHAHAETFNLYATLHVNFQKLLKYVKIINLKLIFEDFFKNSLLKF